MRDKALHEGKFETFDVIAKGPILLGAAFLGLTGMASAILLADERATAVNTAEAAPRPVKAVAKPVPKKPVDKRFVIKSVLPIQGPVKYGEWHWNEDGAPKEGPIVITVDLKARVISIFRSGYEIGAAAVLMGNEEKPTPGGVFPITQKTRHHVSNLYDAPMPYMQRLTDDGVALHASQVELGYASRGRIGMPEPFAAKVFATTTVGDRVFITRGKMVKIGVSLVES